MKNRWMSAMTVFVFAFYSALLLSNFLASRSEDPGKASAENARIIEKLKVREETARKNLLAKPELLNALSYLFMAVLFLGLALDAWLVMRSRQGRPWTGGGFAGADIPWGGRDVFGGFIFLLFAEACFFIGHEGFRYFLGLHEDLPDSLMFAASLLRNLLVAVFVWALIRSRHGRGLWDLGLRFERVFSRAWTGLVGYLAVVPPLVLTFALIALVLNFFSVEAPPQNVVQTFLNESASPYLVPLTVFVALLGPVMEEIFFRGFAYAGLRKRFGVRGAACVVSAAFAALHMNAVAFVPIFILGMFLTYLYENTGSLIPSITAHMLHNGIMIALTLGFKNLSS